MPCPQAQYWDSYYLVEALLQPCSAAEVAAQKTMFRITWVDASITEIFRSTPVQYCGQQDDGHQSVRGNPCPLCGIVHDDLRCFLHIACPADSVCSAWGKDQNDDLLLELPVHQKMPTSGSSSIVSESSRCRLWTDKCEGGSTPNLR